MKTDENVHSVNLQDADIQNNLDAIQVELSEMPDEMVHKQIIDLGINPCDKDRLISLGVANKAPDSDHGYSNNLLSRLKTAFFSISPSPVVVSSLVLALVVYAGYNILLPIREDLRDDLRDDDARTIADLPQKSNSDTAPHLVGNNSTRESLDATKDNNAFENTQSQVENEITDIADSENTVSQTGDSTPSESKSNFQSAVPTDSARKQWVVVPGPSEVYFYNSADRSDVMMTINSGVNIKLQIKQMLGTWIVVTYPEHGIESGYLSAHDCRSSEQAATIICGTTLSQAQ